MATKSNEAVKERSTIQELKIAVKNDIEYIGIACWYQCIRLYLQSLR